VGFRVSAVPSILADRMPNGRGQNSFMHLGLLNGIILLGTLWDLLFLSVLMNALHRWGDLRDGWNGILILLASVAAGCLFVLVPFELAFQILGTTRTLLGSAVLFSGITNIFDFCFVGAIVLLGAFLLLHRLFWSLLERPLYAIHRTLPNRKALFGLGILCLAVWDGHLADTLKRAGAALFP
jgi:hypothetical protein